MDDPLDNGAGSVVTTSVNRYEEVAVAVTSAIATATEHSPLDLPPLAEVGVDPEALDLLFGSSADPSRNLTFHYAGYLVSLFGDGTLTVDHVDE
ncbi:hypothetical protein E6P09_06715 [Haloferax mediterranei ATCC 33500]|uniref:Halobacterial output domain-containing protein n=1 Tax=Haloferax mediterranei (strain ATCC 33500 / DSM 1411 / JCM 8866 / NBRC 14739 / NCIMB 2177 / R-4) TaxID=523841 RepID=I3R2K0_HALMT|nr:HalOD1 output domain-containing protein [Haloferax mediterranei]AFK18460.1 hypothetical protein HFX_0737 [Haloferax mediterranei ATCC 33500]AHZ22154.1 hypothetical protein BM92_05555 [Haloferax mediterranei ATCC 33500]EMA02266.1 hypothetical protein C439_06785 [Haloferax mediterranei ATCC 33500]MDX5988551.1 HalOD1 output domain-containing protein [Haloferax mediterranei ATCC 33500]QCQ74965.1 hypothetical protein E6P09_06715 [Haloferax mediterranei ATCC 33500]